MVAAVAPLQPGRQRRQGREHRRGRRRGRRQRRRSTHTHQHETDHTQPDQVPPDVPTLRTRGGLLELGVGDRRGVSTRRVGFRVGWGVDRGRVVGPSVRGRLVESLTRLVTPGVVAGGQHLTRQFQHVATDTQRDGRLRPTLTTPAGRVAGRLDGQRGVPQPSHQDVLPDPDGLDLPERDCPGVPTDQPAFVPEFVTRSLQPEAVVLQVRQDDTHHPHRQEVGGDGRHDTGCQCRGTECRQLPESGPEVDPEPPECADGEILSTQRDADERHRERPRPEGDRAQHP